MGMKDTCRSANRGGVPSFMLPFTIANGIYFVPAFILSGINFHSNGANFRQKGAKTIFFLVWFGVSSGFWETKKDKNKDIFGFWGAGWGLVACLCGCPLGRVAGLQVSCGLHLLSCVPSFCPAFCPLSCLSSDVPGLNMPLFAILRGF